MAFLAPTEDEDKKQQEGQEAGATGQILSSPGAAPIQGSGSGQSAAATVGNSPKGTSSGSFTNLNSYLNANQGADKAMGQAVTNTGVGRANKADETGTAFQGTASTAIQAGTVSDTSGVTDQIKAAAQGPAPNQADTNTKVFTPTGETKKARTSFQVPAEPAPVKDVQRSAAPTQPAKSPLEGLDQEAFNDLYNATYKGPTQDTLVDVTGYGDTANAYKGVSDFANMAGGVNSDVSSRGAVLDETYNRPGQRYQRGERTLDSFLLGAGEGGVAEINNLANTYGNYDNNFQNILGVLGGQATDATKATDATRENFRTEVGNTTKALEGRLLTAKQQADAANRANADTLSKIKAGDAATLQAMGLGDYAGNSGMDAQHLANLLKNGIQVGDNKMDGVDIGSLLAPAPTQATLARYADDADEGSFQNLMSLLSGAGATPATSQFKAGDFVDSGAGEWQLNDEAVREALAPLLEEAARLKAQDKATSSGFAGSWGNDGQGGLSTVSKPGSKPGLATVSANPSASMPMDGIMSSLGAGTPTSSLSSFFKPIKNKQSEEEILASLPINQTR